MENLVYVALLCLVAVGIYGFAQAWKRVHQRPRDPQLPIPEIPTEFPPKKDPPKVFLDPLINQMHGEHAETVLFVSPAGPIYEVLVNSSSAKIFCEQGWGPFREQVLAWINSPAYCRCRPHDENSPQEGMGELALTYLHGELLGDAQFEQTFANLVQFWLENAEQFGYNKPKKSLT